MITVRFASHPGIFNWACTKLAQGGFWASHCEAVLPDGRRLGSWFHKGGVIIEPADYDKNAFSRELFVKIRATETQVEEFFAFLNNQVGKPYDWLAILAFAFQRDWQEPDSWFCDELLAAGFVACGLIPNSMTDGLNRITVRDLFYMLSMVQGDG